MIINIYLLERVLVQPLFSATTALLLLICTYSAVHNGWREPANKLSRSLYFILLLFLIAVTG